MAEVSTLFLGWLYLGLGGFYGGLCPCLMGQGGKNYSLAKDCDGQTPLCNLLFNKSLGSKSWTSWERLVPLLGCQNLSS